MVGEAAFEVKDRDCPSLVAGVPLWSAPAPSERAVSSGRTSMLLVFLAMLGAAPHAGSLLTPDQKRRLAEVPAMIEAAGMAGTLQGPEARREVFRKSIASVADVGLCSAEVRKLVYYAASARHQDGEHAEAAKSFRVLIDYLWRSGATGFPEYDVLLRAVRRLERQAGWTAEQVRLFDLTQQMAREYIGAREIDRKRVVVLLIDCMKANATLFGEDSPEYAQDLHALAEEREREGCLAEPAKLYERAAKVFRKHLGPASPDFADSIFGLARIRHKEGEHEEAAQLLKEWEKTSGGALGRKERLGRLSDFAVALGQAGEAKWAARVLRRIADSLAADGEIRPLAWTLHNLAGMQANLGNLEDAHRISRQAVDLDAKAEEKDEKHGRILCNHGIILDLRDEYDAAAKMLREAMEILNGCGAGNTHKAHCMRALGLVEFERWHLVDGLIWSIAAEMLPADPCAARP